MIDNYNSDTWRQDEEVEAVLRTRRGPGDLIKLPGPGYMPESQFLQVQPVNGADPDYPPTVKELRTQLVEERLAAASARSETAMAKQAAGVAEAHKQRALADLRAVEDRLRLAVDALEHIRELDAAGPSKPLTFLDVLLPTGEWPGSIAQPCDAVLIVQRQVAGEECLECGSEGEPTTTEVARRPCVLPLGHLELPGHATVDGKEFARDEIVIEEAG
jgi:hypothetical protein